MSKAGWQDFLGMAIILWIIEGERLRQYLKSFAFDGSSKSFQEEDGYVHVKLSLVDSLKSEPKAPQKNLHSEQKKDLELKLLEGEQN